MKLTPNEIPKSLNKAYLKQDLTREQIETFKASLKVLFSKSEIAEDKKEHEEHFNIVPERRNLLKRFCLYCQIQTTNKPSS